MSCTNLEIGKLLPGFMSGELSAEEIETFQEHLLECEECFHNFHFMLGFEDRIKKYGKALFSKCDKKLLYKYLYNRNSLTGPEGSYIKEHLEVCEMCRKASEIEEYALAAAEREEVEPSAKLIGLEKITLRFADDDTEIKLEGYVAAYTNREIYINLTNIETTTEKYDEVLMRFIIADYQTVSKPITVRELKERTGKYIKVGKAETKKKLNLKTIKRAIKFEPEPRD